MTLARQIIFSFLMSLAFFVAVAYRELPSFDVMYAYFYEATHFEGNFVLLDSIPFKKPKVSTIAITRAINAELHSMSDTDLRSIAHARRPCASRLINCQGMSEGWVTAVALQEEVARAKERDQQIAQSSVQATKEATSVALRAAVAAENQARTAYWTYWFTVIMASVGVGGTVFGFLRWLARWWRRRAARLRLTAQPAVAAPITATAPPATVVNPANPTNNPTNP